MRARASARARVCVCVCVLACLLALACERRARPYQLGYYPRPEEFNDHHMGTVNMHTRHCGVGIFPFDLGTGPCR